MTTFKFTKWDFKEEKKCNFLSFKKIHAEGKFNKVGLCKNTNEETGLVFSS